MTKTIGRKENTRIIASFVVKAGQDPHRISKKHNKRENDSHQSKLSGLIKFCEKIDDA